jgi:hypothetical protein
MSAIILAALALGLAQDSTPAPAKSPAKAPPADDRVTIAFENQSLELATIYVVTASGGRFRVGQVIPGRTETLRLPRSVVGAAATIDIVAVPLARRYVIRSGPVTVAPGDTIAASLSPIANLVSVLPAR